MASQVKKLTRASLCACAAVVILYMAAVLPTGRLALTAVAGLAIMLAVVNCGAWYALGAFAVSAVLGVLISPLKSCAAAFSLFLGWYPIVKSFAERIRQRLLEWLVKLLAFNAALAVAMRFFRLLLAEGLGDFGSGWPVAAVWLCANVVFVIYDFGLTQIIQVYLNRFVKK